MVSQNVTLRLTDEIDISRGDMLVSPGAPPAVSDQFRAMLVWLNESSLQLDRTYLLKHTTRQVKAVVRCVHYRVDVNTLNHESAREVRMNGIAAVEIETSGPLFFDSYALSRLTGSFILVDPLSNATVGAGMIQKDLSQHLGRPAAQDLPNTGMQAVTPQERLARRGHRPAILLIPGSVADSAERALFERGFETITLRENSIPSLATGSLISSLWSAAFVVLVVITRFSPETRRIFETVAGSAIIDFTSAAASIEPGELLAEIILRANSLRIRPDAWTSGEAD